MLAKQLLELTIEYMGAEDANRTLISMGLTPNRGQDEIAEEYGRVLKEFLNS